MNQQKNDNFIKEFIYNNFPNKWRWVLIITDKNILTKVPMNLVRNTGIKDAFSLSKYICRKWFLEDLERIYKKFDIIHFHKKWKQIKLY